MKLVRWRNFQVSGCFFLHPLVDFAHIHPKTPPGDEFPACQDATYNLMATILRKNSTFDVNSMHTKFACDIRSSSTVEGWCGPHIAKILLKQHIFRLF